MDSEPVRSRSPGVVAVVALTVLYGGERLLASAFTTGYLFQSRSATWAGIAALVVAYSVWRGYLVGWIATVVLCVLLSIDLALGATVFGLRRVPMVGVVLVVLLYLLLRRDRFRPVVGRDVDELG